MHGLDPKLSNRELQKIRKYLPTIAKKFASSSVRCATMNTKRIYWVNDYVLAPVTKHLRDKDPSATIVFSFRTPFLYGMKQSLYKSDVNFFIGSILSADIITFHRHSDLNNFIDTIKRYYSCSVNDMSNDKARVNVNDRVILLYVVPMGNNKKYRRLLLKTNDCKAFKKNIKREFSRKIIISSVSRFEESKGMEYEITLIDTLLSRYPEFLERVVFLRYYYISQQKYKTAEYVKFHEKYLYNVDKINKRHQRDSWIPIVVHENKLTDEEVAGLFSATNIILLTPIADGFNHLGLEAIFSHRVAPVQLLLSDIGLSDYLRGFKAAARVVDRDVETLAEMIKSKKLFNLLILCDCLLAGAIFRRKSGSTKYYTKLLHSQSSRQKEVYSYENRYYHASQPVSWLFRTNLTC